MSQELENLRKAIEDYIDNHNGQVMVIVSVWWLGFWMQ